MQKKINGYKSKNMEKQKTFILKFLEKEAKALSCDTVPDLNKLNITVQDMHLDLTEGIQDAFSPSIRSNLKSEIFYNTPMIYTPRHLFKLGSYQNDVYRDLWVAYVSEINAVIDEKTEPYAAAFIISEIDNKLKIIGLMHVNIDEMSMKPINWRKSVYNPSDLDIDNLGEFIAAERYKEPIDDGFSMEDYLKDK